MDELVKDFEINIPPTYSHNIFYPIDRSIRRYLSVKNTGDESIKLRYNLRRVDVPRLTVSPSMRRIHQQPPPSMSSLSLKPGESKFIRISMDEPLIFSDRLGQDKTVRLEDSYLALRSVDEMAGEYPINIEVSVFPVGDVSKRKIVVLKHLFKVIPLKKLENTSVRGFVCDEFGKPMGGVEVALRGRSRVYRPARKTDEKGFYDIPCHSYNIHTYHTYDYQLEVEEPGYEFYHRIVEPTLGASVTCNINLKRIDEKIDYGLIKKVRLDMGVYRGDITKDDKYIALGVGYWAESEGYWSRKTGRIPESLHVYVFDTYGNMIWKYPMKGDVWGIDISDDGEYVAACCLGNPDDMYAGKGDLGGREDAEVLLFDKKGELQWKAPQPGKPWEARISPNNRYVAVGEFGGGTYLYDIKGNLLWQKQEEDINRSAQIFFCENGSKMLVGTEPYLFCYDIDGNRLWRTYIGSFPYHTDGMHVSEDGTRIVTCSDFGPMRFLDGDGNILFAREMDGHGRWAQISPDKSFMMAVVVGQEGTTMFDIDGKILWKKNCTHNGMITADSKHILASMKSIMLMNLNGTVVWSYPTNVSTRFCRITRDMSRIVAADDNGYVYFFKKE